MEAIINDKAYRSIRTFLERRDFDIIESNWAHGKDSIDFIAKEDGDLVFISCAVHDNEGRGLGDEKGDRQSFERIAAAYLVESQNIAEGNVRFDIITMLVLGDHKGLLRHHRNALSAAGSDLR
ncbi:MAG: YraN family protein [Raoultibacter sp.]|jgi:putative endonuclease